ncbi:hypothetical protein ACFQ8S_00820 [Streptomyces virginiae]|uniref:hypothetical protein n=1 Tax=Streptomyces virginiae TaxID=1961 RepID=UPI00369AE392
MVPARNASRGAGSTRRGPIWAENLYLLNWERGIDLDGRTTHPEHPEIADPFNVNHSQVSRIFAEDCFWATYTQGQDAQGCHFEHVVTLSCEAGIFDSSTGGNGYVDCYVDGGFSEPPYYMDNQSVLLNCRCEAQLPPQLGRDAQAIGGSFNVGELAPHVAQALGVVGAPFRQIHGTPAKHVGKPFPGLTADFAGGEKIDVVADGVRRAVEFPAASLRPAQVAAHINAAFADLDLPRVATANGFDNRLTIEGWRGHSTGTLAVEGAAATLAKIGFPAVRPMDASLPGQLLSAGQTSHVVFRGYSGPGVNEFGTGQQIEVYMARDGLRPMYWEARGQDPDGHEFGLLRVLGNGRRRYAFTRASLEKPVSLAFTLPSDSLGADQLLANHGIWLERTGAKPVRVLSCSGTPGIEQGAFPRTPEDVAWDMAASPPKRYVRKADGWVAVPAGDGASQPGQTLLYTLNQHVLTNVDDAAGRWQFEGGEVVEQSVHLADYACTRRVITGGTDALNAAMLTLTLFFRDASGQTADNMTLQGTHSFSTGEALGSVSAATGAFASRIGHRFTWSDGGLSIL